jgi:hypothetical protein
MSKKPTNKNASPASSSDSYELGARDSASELSSDPLRTSSEESSSFEEGSPAGPFGDGVYFRCALLDDGGELQARLSPEAMSIFHSTCELNDLSGKTIAVMKTESTGWAKLSKMIGPLITTIAFKQISEIAIDKISDDSKLTPIKYINDKLNDLSDTVFAETKKIVEDSSPGIKTGLFKVLTKMKDTAGGAGGSIGGLLGGVAALALVTRRPVCTYSDAKKQTMLVARFSKTRDAFVIRYTDREDIEAVPMMFVLKINKETKTWELHAERTDEDRLRIQVIKQSMEDDAKSAETDAANAASQRKKQAMDENAARNIEKKKLAPPESRQKAIIDLGAGNAPPPSSGEDLNFIGSESSTIEMDEMFTEEKPKAQHAMPSQADIDDNPFGTPQPEETKLDAMRIDWAESTTSEMSIPAKWRRNAVFGTVAGDFKHEVEKFSRVNVPIFGVRYAIPLLGNSESHRLSFSGNGRVPRDVLAFCSYLVRTTNTVSIDLLFMIAVLTNAPALLLLIFNLIYKILKGKDSKATDSTDETKTGDGSSTQL